MKGREVRSCTTLCPRSPLCVFYNAYKLPEFQIVTRFSLSLNTFQPSVAFHKETNNLICRIKGAVAKLVAMLNDKKVVTITENHIFLTV